MKRTWFLALMAVALVGILAGGATLALFTAQASNQTNQFVSGTLSIDAQRDNGDTVPGPMFYVGPGGGNQPTGLWAPGDMQHRVLQIENTGSLDAWLKSISASLDSGSMQLAQQLDLRITDGPAPNPGNPTDNPFDMPGDFTTLYQGSVASLMSGSQPFLGGPIASAVGDLTNLHFWVRLPLSTDNSYQGLSATVSFTVNAEQMKHNP